MLTVSARAPRRLIPVMLCRMTASLISPPSQCSPTRMPVSNPYTDTPRIPHMLWTTEVKIPVVCGWPIVSESS